jgi:hypothetical protein
MEDAEWALWRESVETFTYATERLRPKSPCQDCTLAFAVEMRREGRCDGVPALPFRPIVLADSVEQWWAEAAG